LKFGVYRVCVYSKNKDFKKIFSFCKDNHYTSGQLKELYQYKDKFEISFQLLPPDEDHDYNALLYDNNDLMYLSDIFKEWLMNMSKIKEKCKDNQLIKYLISSSWGLLCETKKIRVPYDEIENYDLDEYYYLGLNDDGDHEIVDLNNISKYGGFYRIKPFLTASVRRFMFRYAIKNNIVNDIVRIHTDSYCLSKEHNFNIKLNKGIVPKAEAKTTGLIKFENVLYYFHVCNCGFEYKFNKKKENMKYIKNSDTFITCPCGFEYLQEL